MGVRGGEALGRNSAGTMGFRKVPWSKAQSSLWGKRTVQGQAQLRIMGGCPHSLCCPSSISGEVVSPKLSASRRFPGINSSTGVLSTGRFGNTIVEGIFPFSDCKMQEIEMDLIGCALLHMDYFFSTGGRIPESVKTNISRAVLALPTAWVRICICNPLG